MKIYLLVLLLTFRYRAGTYHNCHLYFHFHFKMKIKKNTMFHWVEFLAHIPSSSQSLLGNSSQWLLSKKGHTSFHLRWSSYRHPATITYDCVDQLAGSALSSPWVNPDGTCQYMRSSSSPELESALKLLSAYQEFLDKGIIVFSTL